MKQFLTLDLKDAKIMVEAAKKKSKENLETSVLKQCRRASVEAHAKCNQGAVITHTLH